MANFFLRIYEHQNFIKLFLSIVAITAVATGAYHLDYMVDQIVKLAHAFSGICK